MIIERPRRPESAIDALGVALRVLVRPSFLWVPVAFGLVFGLPALFFPQPPIGGPSSQAELEAWIQAVTDQLIVFVPIWTVASLALAPLAAAAMLRLAAQHLDGQPALPFGPGFLVLAWRLFLQMLIYFGLLIASVAVGAIIVGIGVALGLGLPAIIVAVLVGTIGYLLVGLRVTIASALLLTGGRPWESIRRSWDLTRGRVRLVLRWFLALFLVVGGASAVIGGVTGGLFGGSTPGPISVLLSGVLSAFNLVTFVMVVRLSRLLTDLAPAGGSTATPGPIDPATASASVASESGIAGGAA